MLNEIIITNVNFICKNMDVKKGLLEAYMDRPRGYFSRKPKLTVCDLEKICEYLKLDITEITDGSFTKKVSSELNKIKIQQLQAEINEKLDLLEKLQNEG